MKKYTKVYIVIGFFLLSALVAFLLSENRTHTVVSYVKSQVANVQLAFLPVKDAEGNILYRGNVYHIFFHSLIIYPKLAFDGGRLSRLYENYMVTRDEFQKILPELYKNNFILIDITSLYGVNKDGTVVKKPIYLPQGKKPLILSVDDLSYYHSMVGHGFADKLVLDKDGKVSTEVVTPEGKTEITRDGDVVPILDDFVSAHPDFSFKGARGVIALTGYEGVLGYRTDSLETENHPKDTQSAEIVISQLKNTGWRFASHSYTHDPSFSTGAISLESLKKDAELWDKEVRPLVGDTDIFIGPFGQVFKKNDPRRTYLISRGFKILCGVGAEPYLHYFSDHVAMDRADIDGYRLVHTPNLLKTYFSPVVVIDPLRKIFR